MDKFRKLALEAIFGSQNDHHAMEKLTEKERDNVLASVRTVLIEAFDMGRAHQRVIDAGICEELGWQKCESAVKARIAGRREVESHRDSDAETCVELEKRILAAHAHEESNEKA
jgi:hypothetical protein